MAAVGRAQGYTAQQRYCIILTGELISLLLLIFVSFQIITSSAVGKIVPRTGSFYRTGRRRLPANGGSDGRSPDKISRFAAVDEGRVGTVEPRHL